MVRDQRYSGHDLSLNAMPLNIEHDYWRGAEYSSGIDGQKIAIVGYSHYRKEGRSDANDYTSDTVRGVINRNYKGGYKIAFFTQIAHYFGDDQAFWNKVMFFNFLPECIGAENDKFNEGSDELSKRGRERFHRLLKQEMPHKVLVFTKKGWGDLPSTIEEASLRLHGTLPLGSSFPQYFRWGSYVMQDFKIMTFGLRHPQGANGDLMRRAVQRILSMPL